LSANGGFAGEQRGAAFAAKAPSTGRAVNSLLAVP